MAYLLERQKAEIEISERQVKFQIKIQLLFSLKIEFELKYRISFQFDKKKNGITKFHKSEFLKDNLMYNKIIIIMTDFPDVFK